MSEETPHIKVCKKHGIFACRDQEYEDEIDRLTSALDQLRGEVVSLRSLLAAERDSFGKRETELMKENRELRGVLAVAINHLEEYGLTTGYLKIVLERTGEKK